MLMMNQPGVPAATPPPPAATGPRPAAGAAPPGAGYSPSKLKGTMVGVAPMAGGGFGLPPAAAPPAAWGAAPGTSAVATAPMPEMAPAAFSAPPAQAGVNPLGGTVAADAGVFGAFAANQPGGGGADGSPSPYAATQGLPAAGGMPTGAMPAPAPPGPPFLRPPGAPAAYGAPPGFAPPGAPPPFAVPPPPPATYGTPPQGPQAPYGGPYAPPYGQPPPAYGQLPPFAPPPTPAGFGGAMGGPSGDPGAQAITSLGQPPMPSYGGGMIGALKSQWAVTTGPTKRNALMTWLLPASVIFGGVVLSILLGFISAGLSGIGSLVVLGGTAWSLLLAIKMVSELQTVTKSEALAWWPILVPFYNMYFMWLVVPQEVTKAKQMLGAGEPAQPLVLYVFLWHFALATDLNGLVR
jgi:hypothetical protein